MLTVHIAPEARPPCKPGWSVVPPHSSFMAFFSLCILYLPMMLLPYWLVASTVDRLFGEVPFLWGSRTLGLI